ncbi:hypothetical protein HK096_010731, partial [Nowakowskiella sp. JEL0078]
TQLEKTRERAQQLAGFDPGANFSGKFGEFLKSSALFGGMDPIDQSLATVETAATGGNIIEDLFQTTVSIESAKAALRGALRQLGKSYCFLLLLISQCSGQPAKERFHFEHVYNFTKEITSKVFNLPQIFKISVDDELDRLFRSSLFATSHSSSNPFASLAFTNPTIANAANATTNETLQQTVTEVKRPVSVKGTKRTSIVAWATSPKMFISASPFEESVSKSGISRKTNSKNSKKNKKERSSDYMQSESPTLIGQRELQRRSLSGVNNSVPDDRQDEEKIETISDVKQIANDDSESSRNTKTKPFSKIENDGLMAQINVQVRKRRTKISINDVRMLRSPLADAVLPVPQRFLFVQTK